MKKNKNCIIVFLITSFVFGIFLFLISIHAIKKSVDNKCSEAQSMYEGDCVTALTSWLDDESNSYRSRNSAIWALGQLGDSKALSTLEKYYTGEIPSREPIDNVISQYELKKAIKLLNGGFNAARALYKHL